MKARLLTAYAVALLFSSGIFPLCAESDPAAPKNAVQSGVAQTGAAQPSADKSASAQSGVAKNASAGNVKDAKGAKDSKASGDGSLPDAYRGISLGMAMDAVKEQLLADGLFGYRGERDVSLLPTMNRSLIETVGPSFIKRSWFQFHEDKLYVMTFNLDSSRVDYYSMYSTLVSKYGEPVTLDPRKAVWDDGKIILSLERPLTVRYVDEKAFNDLLAAAGTEKAASDLQRESFIGDF
ncbi:MAG TPA: hypothetical protein PK542_10625 [Treponemataceae bacterium]|nr:hypothetical protein [Treponemataceae bacterium]HPS44931.1 hypothetical protein [Treponemataceae bacterium]